MTSAFQSVRAFARKPQKSFVDSLLTLQPTSRLVLLVMDAPPEAALMDAPPQAPCRIRAGKARHPPCRGRARQRFAGTNQHQFMSLLDGIKSVTSFAHGINGAFHLLRKLSPPSVDMVFRTKGDAPCFVKMMLFWALSPNADLAFVLARTSPARASMMPSFATTLSPVVSFAAAISTSSAH